MSNEEISSNDAKQNFLKNKKNLATIAGRLADFSITESKDKKEFYNIMLQYLNIVKKIQPLNWQQLEMEKEIRANIESP